VNSAFDVKAHVSGSGAHTPPVALKHHPQPITGVHDPQEV
jgi:hypothetical protein